MGKTLKPFASVFLKLVLGSMLLCAIPVSAQSRWTAEKANAWYAAQPWLSGANFSPSTAINQLEMWQAESFDLATIDRELGWAKQLGMNSMRVFLHDLVWKQDPEAFIQRLDQFLAVADKHGIRVMFVLFDGVWDPHPKLGRQRDPRPHTHNSGWVQSPGVEILSDLKRHDELRDYVEGMMKTYGNDKRVIAWDLFNEPDNPNAESYPGEPKNKEELALTLLKKAFAWARAVNPSQPLTAGVWHGNWADPAKIPAVEKYMLEESDVISFHSYTPITVTRKHVEELQRYGRPLLCTEYMNRPVKSTFDPALGYFKEQKVAAYNWGLVSGKTQTIYPWDSWKKTYTAEPAVWFHDILRPDGTPFDAKEAEYIKKVTGAK